MNTIIILLTLMLLWSVFIIIIIVIVIVTIIFIIISIIIIWFIKIVHIYICQREQSFIWLFPYNIHYICIIKRKVCIPQTTGFWIIVLWTTVDVITCKRLALVRESSRYLWILLTIMRSCDVALLSAWTRCWTNRTVDDDWSPHETWIKCVLDWMQTKGPSSSFPIKNITLECFKRYEMRLSCENEWVH